MIRLVRVEPKGYPHSRALDEVEDCLYHGMRHLNEEVTRHPLTWWNEPMPATEGTTDVRIFVGAHLLHDHQLAQITSSDVIYNTEQVLPDSPWLRQGYIKALATARAVWDFSGENARRWRLVYGLDVQHVPLGYVKELEGIALRPSPELDVLFYGSPSPRRLKALLAIESKGLKVLSVFGKYGLERDRLIASAKLVVNIHFHDDSVLETVRLAYLLSNGVPVISEATASQVYAEHWFPCLWWCSYSELASVCAESVSAWQSTRQQALANRKRFTFLCPQEAYLWQSGLFRQLAGSSHRKPEGF